MKTRALLVFFKYFLGFGILAWAVWSHWDIRDLNGENVGVKPALQRDIYLVPLLLSCVARLISIHLTFIRWFLLMRGQGLPFSLSSAFRLGLIGVYFSTFLPGSIGGDLVKALYMAREQERRTVAIATVVIDRAVGLCGLICLIAVVGGYLWANGDLDGRISSSTGSAFLKDVVLGSAVFVTLCLFLWCFLGRLSEQTSAAVMTRLGTFFRIGQILSELGQALLLYRRTGHSIPIALVISMVSHMGFLVSFYFAARTLFPEHDIPSVESHFLVVPIGMLIRAGCPTPAGIGGGEVAFGELYVLMNYPYTSGLLASLVSCVISWLFGLVGYVVFLNMKTGHDTGNSGTMLGSTVVYRTLEEVSDEQRRAAETASSDE